MTTKYSSVQSSHLSATSSSIQSLDEVFMRRCLQLAACGRATARPNPMVGAVIVCDGKIIGEGYHVRCGEGHAEVNAFASVSVCDEPLLPRSTIYVSLEPCSHYGKTPPCADLIVSKGVSRCVCGCVDPNAKVQGRGIERMRAAGIEVTVGVLEDECRELNRAFFTFHSCHRPYITLKWAQTSDGFIDRCGQPLAISTPFTKMLVHKLRAESDAILVGRITDEREHPALNVRHWSGKNPRRIVLSHQQTQQNPSLACPSSAPVLPSLLDSLYADGIQSLLVEGGATTHRSFLSAGLWDEIRVETAPIVAGSGTPAASLPTNIRLVEEKEYDGNIIWVYRRKE